MADTRYRVTSQMLPIRTESGKLILPDQIGSRIENMYLTEEGTLRSVWGPAPYVPDYGDGSPYTYFAVRGIFHATLGADDHRDILLMQDRDEIRVLEGWNTSGVVWKEVIGNSANAMLTADFGWDSKPRFPPQFEATPNGIVIIPSGESSRAFFYDGDAVAPLGYESSPSPPQGLSPKTTDEDWYMHNGLTMARGDTVDAYPVPGAVAGLLKGTFGQGRIGSVSLDATVSTESGRVQRGSYRAAMQWLDRWGNLSPLSGPSGPVTIPAVKAVSGMTNAEAEDWLYQICWTSIDPGPDRTIGRILCRTHDEINSGTTKLFEVPAYVETGFLSPATIPDNVTEMFPDNCPDSWLVQEPKTPVAVRPFKLYTLAFGRGWAANFEDEPGKLHPSMPGRWGTFLEGDEIYPDPQADQITGMIQVPEGLLVFTQVTTFLITVSYGGEGFQTRTIHPRVGCVAPSSLEVMPDGRAIWLGREGFYSYQKEQIQLLSEDIGRDIRNFNHGRTLQSVAAVDVREGKYRCWVPFEGSLTNNMCFEYDGAGWTRRDDVAATGVCVTRDHRAYMIASGTTMKAGTANPVQGVWVLDHEVQSFVPTPRASTIRTSWLRAPVSLQRGSPTTVYLWLRETELGSLTVEVERDWRGETDSTGTALTYPPDDIPPFWNVTLYNQADADGVIHSWEKRRPYWTRVDIYAPSAETFRLKLTHTGSWEFLGLSFDEVPHPDTFRGAPK